MPYIYYGNSVCWKDDSYTPKAGETASLVFTEPKPVGTREPSVYEKLTSFEERITALENSRGR